MVDWEVPEEDRAFVELFKQTAEFDEDDPEYLSYVNFNLRAVERGHAICEKLTPFVELTGAKALDIGSGSAGIAIALAQRGAQVEAIEPDPVRRQWAEQRINGHHVDVTIAACYVEQLPYESDLFNVVTCDSVLEHVESPSVAVAEICRVLSPNGVVYLNVPNKASLVNVLRDPHYQMFGVVLMPRWLGRWYVERVRKNRRGYWVNVIPTRSWMRRSFSNGHVLLSLQVPEEFDKLHRPAAITKHPWIRRLARFAELVGAAPALERLALYQRPVNEFVGIKRR
jgi:2-polyprenyl-3-methyl-5-hydroxy-6-metoxy-1,4-benzoquinol methylase